MEDGRVIKFARVCKSFGGEEVLHGLTFDVRDNATDNLAASLEQLMTDPAHLRKLAEAGYDHAKRCTPDNIADDYLSDFERVLAAK
jgi:hypothetical protein